MVPGMRWLVSGRAGDRPKARSCISNDHLVLSVFPACVRAVSGQTAGAVRSQGVALQGAEVGADAAGCSRILRRLGHHRDDPPDLGAL